MSTAKPDKKETGKLARAAYEKSGCKTHEDFCELFGGAISLRSFRYWLAGGKPATPLAALVLREFVSGWRPRCV